MPTVFCTAFVGRVATNSVERSECEREGGRKANFQRAQMTRKNSLSFSSSAWKTMVVLLLCLEWVILMSEAVSPRLHHFNSANAIQTHGGNFFLGKLTTKKVKFYSHLEHLSIG